MSYPTPWTVSATEALDHDDKTTVQMAQIVDSDGAAVCQLRGPDAAELAVLIVRAVNAKADKDAELRDRFAMAIAAGDSASNNQMSAKVIWMQADELVKARP